MKTRTETTVGDRIRAARHARGWSLRDLAARLGVSHQTVGHAEKGRHTPSHEWVIRCASALGVSPAQLAPELARALLATPTPAIDPPASTCPESRSKIHRILPVGDAPEPIRDDGRFPSGTWIHVRCKFCGATGRAWLEDCKIDW
jgi:transcriptional regulator with XRE-family HTH domain